MRRPKLCGRNTVYIPESGCDDCAQLEYRVAQLEEAINAQLPYRLESDFNEISLIAADGSTSVVTVEAVASCAAE